MILRPRQETFVENSVTALEKHHNTIAVGATGFGKTICLSTVTNQIINGGHDARAVIVAHRDELTRQNSETFKTVCPETPISFYNADRKSWRGRVTFSMIQTLSQEKHLEKMPPMDLLVYDEAHHVASNSYRRLTARAKELNPNVKIYGVTATPERGDKKGLKNTFNNVADIVPIGELVRSGDLVEPQARVVNIGTQDELQKVKKTANDYDMAEVEAIQNSVVNNHQIVAKWMDLAPDRPSVAFCATIQHALDVCDAFRDAGIAAEAVHSKMPMKERRAKLEAFDRGEIPVLSNPLLLTEGWDSPRCSCIMLLRPLSHKSTMIQMIGRALRKLNPKQYPGIVKKNSLILDFGISLLTHGDIFANVKLTNDKIAEGQAPIKTCPECGAELPIKVEECIFCGYEFQVLLDPEGFYNELEEFRLVAFDLMGRSPFRWISIFPSERVLICTGFSAWTAVVSTNDDDWFAIGGGEGMNPDVLNICNQIGAVSSADDFMRLKETPATAKKAALWMTDPASAKQIQILQKFGITKQPISKVEAAANLTFFFNQFKIEKLIGVQ